jgi:hypothetical protein
MPAMGSDQTHKSPIITSQNIFRENPF